MQLIADPTTYLMLPIVELVDKTKISQTKDVRVDVWVDRTSNYDKISTKHIALPGNFAAPLMPFYEAAPVIVNLVLRWVIKTDLQLSSIQFTTPERSCILQLVDAIANFSLNFIRFQVDPHSVTSKTKAFKKDKFELLMQLFGLDSIQIAHIGAQIGARSRGNHLNWRRLDNKSHCLFDKQRGVCAWSSPDKRCAGQPGNHECCRRRIVSAVFFNGRMEHRFV